MLWERMHRDFVNERESRRQLKETESSGKRTKKSASSLSKPSHHPILAIAAASHHKKPKSAAAVHHNSAGSEGGHISGGDYSGVGSGTDEEPVVKRTSKKINYQALEV